MSTISKLLTFWIPIKKIRKSCRQKIDLHFYYKSKEFLSAKMKLEEQISKNPNTIAMITCPFDVELFQRPQHMMTSFALYGRNCLYISKYYQPLYTKHLEKLTLCDLDLFLHIKKELYKNLILVYLSPNNHLTYNKLLELKKLGVKIVYEYIDEFSDTIQPDMKDSLEIFSKLEHLDPVLVIGTAKKLEQELLQRFPKRKVLLNRNAVDVDHFINSDKSIIPEDMIPILNKNKPIVGYYGALSGWLDWDIINNISEKCPQYEFVYIGPDYYDNRKNLILRENVHCLGSKDYKELPNYANHFNCCTIIFGNDEIAASTSPLKLFEYMALQKPTIVTDNLIECKGYDGVFLSHGTDEFVANLHKAIEISNNECVKQNLLKQAKKNTWLNRAQDFLRSLDANTCMYGEKKEINSELASNYRQDFIKKINKNKYNNLYIATGIISLINAMAIIKSKNISNSSNHLIVYTNKIDNQFIENNEKLILENYFDNISFLDATSDNANIQFIEERNFLNNFNEIYTTAQPALNIYDKHNNITLFEEGLSAYVHFDEIDYSNIKTIYLSEYFDRIHYPQKGYDIKKLDKDCIKTIINKIIEKNNLDFSYLKRENQILLLAQYIYCDILEQDDVVKFYTNHIDSMLAKGYSVLFKSHPRVNDTILPLLKEHYKNDKRFQVVPTDIKYPIEIMVEQISPIAIVTSASGGAINCAHLFDIPCYGFGSNLAKRHPAYFVRQNADVFINLLDHISKLHYVAKVEKDEIIV